VSVHQETRPFGPYVSRRRASEGTLPIDLAMFTTQEAWRREVRVRERAAISSFVEGALGGRIDDIGGCLNDLEATGMARRSFRRLAKSRAVVPEHYREAFLRRWVHDGDSVRNMLQDDVALIEGLRKLLPAYTGPAVTLFRGDSSFNRQRRTYGLSWTTSEEIARSFMNDIWRTFRWRLCAAEDGSTGGGGDLFVRLLERRSRTPCRPTSSRESRGYRSRLSVVHRRIPQFIEPV
jgi:hypothetical protein